MIIGIAFGCYCFLYFIITTCCFCYERQKFVQTGTSDNPGTLAQYDLEGNFLLRNVINQGSPQQPNQQGNFQILDQTKEIEIQIPMNPDQSSHNKINNQLVVYPFGSKDELKPSKKSGNKNKSRRHKNEK